ncbi:hypothetical protein PUN28_010222 [Cardiocondyla obscurior]|uniref:Transmembrane protein n=1 Tax=Cardiocondyla obscurior TaxID=286306 RepID=A0AAW2FR52_9HYME
MKCLHVEVKEAEEEGDELRESARIDGRSLDESRHKLRRLMKSFMPKLRGVFITSYCVPFALARVIAVSLQLLLPRRGKCTHVACGMHVASSRCVARVDRYRLLKRIAYAVIFVVITNVRGRLGQVYCVRIFLHTSVYCCCYFLCFFFSFRHYARKQDKMISLYFTLVSH